MKKFYKALSIILSATLVLTAMCIPAAAADTSTGYWKYAGTKTYIFRVGGEYVPEEKRETSSYRVDGEYEYSKTDVSSGKISMVYNHDKHESFYGNDLYGQNYKISVTFYPPAQYYLKDADVNIRLNISIENNSPQTPGTGVGVYFTAETPTEKNMGGYDIGGFTGELKTNDGKKADTSYSGYIGAAANTNFDCTGTYTAKFTAVNVNYGDIRNIVVSAGDNKVVYTYKWTKGTPSTDNSSKINGFIIPMKKGTSIILGTEFISGSGSVTWSTSDKSIATVTSSGKISAKKKGTAIITAKCGSTTIKIKVKVT